MILFGVGTALLLVGRYIKPEGDIFDRWIDRVIDGAKQDVACPEGSSCGR
ncbi:hypothetical protein [Bradyrhizobium sp. SBR1B]|nr:hypothetical protein [Bradyrhizobium sp. SBR1B]MBB4378212.1 hypothetical protein [Bradyrhizobium sp. SBR1B]